MLVGVGGGEEGGGQNFYLSLSDVLARTDTSVIVHKDFSSKVRDRAPFFALVQYAWILLPKRFDWLVSQTEVTSFCFLCIIKARPQTKTQNKKLRGQGLNNCPLSGALCYTNRSKEDE